MERSEALKILKNQPINDDMVRKESKYIATKLDISDETAFIIDKEVKLIISECYKKATEILNENLENLHLMAASLVEYETLDSAQIDDIMAGAKPRAPGSKEDKTKSKEKNDPSVGDAAEQS